MDLWGLGFRASRLWDLGTSSPGLRFQGGCPADFRGVRTEDHHSGVAALKLLAELGYFMGSCTE